jgi:lysozyme
MDKLLALIKRFEGFSAKPYMCPAGVATIGYGSTRYLDGTKVTLRDNPITPAMAEQLVIAQINAEYLPETLRLCPKLSGDRLTAIVDFSYNLGIGRLKSSTLRKRINAEDWESVPKELMRWNKGGGKVLRGLTARRIAECILI